MSYIANGFFAVILALFALAGLAGFAAGIAWLAYPFLSHWFPRKFPLAPPCPPLRAQPSAYRFARPLRRDVPLRQIWLAQHPLEEEICYEPPPPRQAYSRDALQNVAGRRLPSGARVLNQAEPCDICGKERKIFPVKKICLKCADAKGAGQE